MSSEHPKYFLYLSRLGQMILGTDETNFGGDTVSFVFNQVCDPDRASFLFGGVDYEGLVNKQKQVYVYIFDRTPDGKLLSENKIKIGHIKKNIDYTP